MNILRTVTITVCFCLLAITQIEAKVDKNDLLIKKGKSLYKKKLYRQAYEEFSRVIRKNPGVSEAFYYRALTNRRLRKYELAIDDFSRAIDLNPDKAKYYYHRGNTYLSIYKNRLAIKDFNKGVRKRKIYNAASNNRDSYRDYLRKKFVVEDNGRVLTVFGSLRHGTSDVFAEFIERHPDIEIVRLQSLGGRLHDAKKIIRVIKKRNLSTYVSHRCVSACTRIFLAGRERSIAPNAKMGFHRPVNFWANRKSIHAIPDISQKRRVFPVLASHGVSDGFILKAMRHNYRTYYYAPQSELLKESIATKVETDPRLLSLKKHKRPTQNLSMLYASLAKRLVIARRYHIAERFYYKAIDLDPTNITAHFGQLKTVRKTASPYVLLSTINTILKQFPDSADGYAARAAFYKKEKRFDLALADYTRVIELEPEDARTYAFRAHIHAIRKDYRLALNDLDKSIRLEPTYPYAFYLRGWINASLKRYDLTFRYYKKALHLNPRYSRVYRARGFIYRKQRRLRLALQDFNSAIKYAPKDARALYYRATVYASTRRYELALRDLNKAIFLKPRIAIHYRTRARVYRRMGLHENAERDFRTYDRLRSRSRF